ncbi:GNAT family N-acetyltransferase [Streptomyces sp. NPDC046805]|uniref:GNAT family N-acetyltransferase n=1 Tax=Streptomyces sp. NPDC046805 TaxID=3155134 RepID=UPI0033D821C3
MAPLPGDRFPSPAGSLRSLTGEGSPPWIRAVTEDDLPALLRLDTEAFPSEPYPYFVLRQFLDVYGDHMLVLDDGTTLRGYVVATSPHAAGSWILSLVVTPGLRGRGLGRRLMREILHRLHAESVTSVRLTVEPGNDTAVVLYRSLGFTPEGEPRKDYFGPGQSRLVMRLAM